jgi:hypothetical protein
MSAVGSPRFVLKITISPGRDNDVLCDDDLADDNMEAIAQLLRRNEEEGIEHEDVPQSRAFRFDLCPDCNRRYQKDPLNRDVLRALEFSKN